MDKTPKTKVCTKCGKRKALDKFYKDPRYKFGVKAWCATCCAAMLVRHYPKHAAKRIAASKAYGKANRHTLRIKERARYRKNPKRKIAQGMESRKRNGNKQVINMSDCYIAIQCLRMPLKDVPPALIEAKRIQLQIKRYLKNGR